MKPTNTSFGNLLTSTRNNPQSLTTCCYRLLSFINTFTMCCCVPPFHSLTATHPPYRRKSTLHICSLITIVLNNPFFQSPCTLPSTRLSVHAGWTMAAQYLLPKTCQVLSSLPTVRSCCLVTREPGQACSSLPLQKPSQTLLPFQVTSHTYLLFLRAFTKWVFFLLLI